MCLNESCNVLELQHAATSTVSKTAVLTRANEQHPLPLGALVQVLISKDSKGSLDSLRLMVKRRYMHLESQIKNGAKLLSLVSYLLLAVPWLTLCSAWSRLPYLIQVTQRIIWSLPCEPRDLSPPQCLGAVPTMLLTYKEMQSKSESLKL